MADRICRLIKHEVTDPYMNLAFDEAILDAMRINKEIPCTVRIWRNERSVVLGRFQSVAEEANVKACKEFSVRIARRSSGGGAVYTDLGNINWSLYLRPKADNAPIEIRALFERVGEGLASALSGVGVRAKFASNGVYISENKVSGLAMHAKGQYRVLHGTLLVRSDLAILDRVLNKSPDRSSRYTKSLRVPTTNLSFELSEDFSIDSGVALLEGAILGAVNARPEDGGVTPHEEELARIQCNTKYSQPEWIFCIP